MNPMFAAIRKRKSGGAAVMGDHQDVSHEAQHADDKNDQPQSEHGQGKDLHGLVASLSETEKGHLKTILDKDNGSAAMSISKGGPSTDEKSKIQAQIQKEDQANAVEESEDGDPQGAVDSDAIGKSMLDSRHKSGAADGQKPRNLNDRMQMNIASKLKAKGKL